MKLIYDIDYPRTIFEEDFTTKVLFNGNDGVYSVIKDQNYDTIVSLIHKSIENKTKIKFIFNKDLQIVDVEEIIL